MYIGNIWGGSKTPPSLTFGDITSHELRKTITPPAHAYHTSCVRYHMSCVNLSRELRKASHRLRG